MWSSLGSPPAPDEAEITLLGPGHGESVVIHLGRGEWLIVDSCIDATAGARTSAPLRYLRSVGVQVETAVKLIVISHWDDDHARGIADIVDVCRSAQLCGTPGITERDFDAFVEAKWLGAAATDGANVRDIRRMLEILWDRRQPIVKVVPAKTLKSSPLVRSWSPSDHETDLFLGYIARMHPKATAAMSKAIPPGTPNLTSIVLTIDWDDASALFGADMEAHSDDRRGWGAVVAEGNAKGIKRSNVVKIPHHGSHTGHDARMWSDLLLPGPVSVIAPFGRGPIDRRPPKSSDLRRINKLSASAFLTTPHRPPKPPKRDYAVSRSLRESHIRLTSRKAPMGIVRLRRRPGQSWRHDLFGPARRIK